MCDSISQFSFRPVNAQARKRVLGSPLGSLTDPIDVRLTQTTVALAETLHDPRLLNYFIAKDDQFNGLLKLLGLSAFSGVDTTDLAVNRVVGSPQGGGRIGTPDWYSGVHARG